ncbi:type II toxin-antitoxin system RelE/ParE family toxin [Haloarcula sp. JP-Z28]|uniref:type II toxin-antitoxin system RelE/ParE family toxin n=1 Tax=Haloarcula sp. JP-Z28 TaxID=2716715 RepID=UPI001404F547|nr:type II toxin-antitoxin system RelE/ParE family toxin [Haloarcula sp. JP-Z28]NHN62453.1 type II toxin-antitoxin system RelE/ParE family toxin [Haloarcula sp. JP-Z28]
MSEYDVLLGDDARAFLEAAGEKTTRICKKKLGYLAAYPSQGRGNKEKLPIDGRRDRYRLHVSRTYTAFCTIVEDETEVRVLEILPIDEAHDHYGF